MSFVLSCQAHHDSDVRGVSPLPTVDGAFLASSRDKTVGVWLCSPTGVCDPMNRFAIHEHFVSASAFHPSFTLADNTPCVVSVSHDKHVLAYSLESGQLEAVMDGHAGAVSCVSIGPTGDVVTGGWDSVAIVWRKGEASARLVGHANSVLSVAALRSGEFLTGSGDKTIIRWSSTGTRLHTYTHHKDSVQALCEVPGFGFLSGSNDTRVILCALDGTVLASMEGHEGFVYSVALLPSGEFASTSEDRTLRIWRQSECVQTIYHPTTVWAVCALPTGALVTGCADGFARVWTRVANDAAPIDVMDSFQAAVSAAQISTRTMSSQLDPSRVEPRTALAIPGNTEGQMRFVKAEHGTGIEVYSWSKPSWTKIGDVADSAGGAGGAPAAPQKTSHLGKEYDYVFDIDFNGKQSLKLPYNEGDNPWTAAQMFIMDNVHLGVSQLDKESIVKWILQHTNAGKNPATANPPGFAQPAAKPAAVVIGTGNKTFAATNFEGIAKKLNELEAPLPPTLLAALQGSQEITDAASDALENLLSKLRPNDRFPAVDLFRHAALYSRNVAFLTRFAPRVVTLFGRTASPMEEMVCLRAAANLVANGAAQAGDLVVSIFSSPVVLEEHYGAIRRSPRLPNREALAAVVFNVSRYAAVTPSATAMGANIVSFLGDVLMHEQEASIKVTALTSLKHLFSSAVSGPAAKERAQLALTYGCVHANSLFGDPDLIALALEVLAFLPKPAAGRWD